MALEKSDIATGLAKALEATPCKAERFNIVDDFEIDLLEFNDRPYKGVNSIITNGVSNYRNTNPFEFILTFDPNTLSSETDLFAFVATYLQLHFLPNLGIIEVGDYFSQKGRLIKGLEFTGIYTAKPCYFPAGCFEKLFKINFLWLIPIYSSEFEYLTSNGSNSFESFIEEHDPDLSLFNRSPLNFNV